MEEVNGFECKVFSANNVEVVSKTRTEHLPRGRRPRTPRAPLAGLLALADSEDMEPEPLITPDKEDPGCSGFREDPPPVTWQEYFGEEALQRDVGRPQELSTKVQKFKATMWLCEDYPLELQEQIMPILDLMTAISSPHFAKLKDFVQMQLPSGFPVKIEIPLFHVLNARITFGNIFARDADVPHVESVHTDGRLACLVDERCFSVGAAYRDLLAPAARCDAHDELLHYAIQQSLMEAGSHDDQVDVWEALRGAAPAPPRAAPPLLPPEETQLQRAIEESLAAMTLVASDASPPEVDPELAEVLALSVREQATRDEQLEAERRALDEALRLSLLEK